MIGGVSELVDVLAVVGGGLLVSWWVSRRPSGRSRGNGRPGGQRE